jgi:hypothetical protein
MTIGLTSNSPPCRGSGRAAELNATLSIADDVWSRPADISGAGR